MSEHVDYILQLEVKPGELETFRTLMNEMVDATRANEPGTLHYEWHISDDGTTCHLYERYADSAATMTHIGAFGEKYAERFLAAATPTALSVYGSPSAEVKEALSGLGAEFFGSFGGFAR